MSSKASVGDLAGPMSYALNRPNHCAARSTCTARRNSGWRKSRTS